LGNTYSTGQLSRFCQRNTTTGPTANSSRSCTRASALRIRRLTSRSSAPSGFVDGSVDRLGDARVGHAAHARDQLLEPRFESVHRGEGM
jgi:hypothetical protein